MTLWMRYEKDGQTGFGRLEDETIAVHEGDLFGETRPSGETLPLQAVSPLIPCQPSKMIGLWNNFHALAEKLGSDRPEEPLYFLKSSNAFLPSGGAILRPEAYSGRVVFEGELGVVIGRPCKAVTEAEAWDHIFGYTCVNDVTAVDLLNRDPAFPQWVRAKSFDTFGAFGPAIATGLDPASLRVRSILNGEERQNYPVSDMILPPARIVSLLSREMTLYPCDVIACGTSIGAGSMKAPMNRIEIAIEGIGSLVNSFANP